MTDELIKRIQDALGTAEEGDALVEVARNAHAAERAAAHLIHRFENVIDAPPTAFGERTIIREELAITVAMIRALVPQVYPANEHGQVHFMRAVMEAVADVIERALG